MADLKIPPAPDSLSQKFMTAVIFAVVVSGLYFGRPVLLPLALAVLMSFALAPLVGLLRRLRLGDVGPVLICVLLAGVVMSSLAPFMAAQLASRPADLPRYQTNLSHKVQSVVGTAIHNN